MSTSDELPAQLAAIGAFLERAPLRSTVSELEVALAGCGRTQAADVVKVHGITPELLRAALAARDAFGKLSDLIHAAAIALALPHILEPGEELVRPSLAAGNTPDRLFDVETNRRIAEFKLSRWDGHDGGRQQPAVKDLVRLAADTSGRKAELYVRGERPIAWLTNTSSSVRQQLRRYSKELTAFEAAFGDPGFTVSAFVAGAGSHVAVIDVEQIAPGLFGGL